MDNEKRWRAVEQDIERLMQQAIADPGESGGGMIGLGATWLAFEMWAKLQQEKDRETKKEGEEA